MTTCTQCKSTFEITESHREYYKHFQVPDPPICPLCRQKNRILFRNFKVLYNRKSDKTARPMLSMYAPDSKYIVWDIAEWWADDWDDLQHGRDFDFKKPFFEQYKELTHVQPRFAIMNTLSENCHFANMTYASKNCYYVFGCVENEDCYFGNIVWNSKNCMDCLYVFKSELCYECVDSISCFNCKYSQDCENCTDSLFLYDCVSCDNCIGGVGLRRKSYHIFNQPVSRGEYNKFIKSHDLSDTRTMDELKRKFDDLKIKAPHRAAFITKSEDFSGNHIYNCKKVYNCYDLKEAENCQYIYTAKKLTGCQDVSFTVYGELMYNCLSCGGNGGGYDILASHQCFNGGHIAYSDQCFNCNNIFGCFGLKKKEYCILNKQYSAQDYTALRDKIVKHMQNTGEWGQFFPKELCPFAYNESALNEYYPLSREEALGRGYRWRDDTGGMFAKETLNWEKIPAKIGDVSETVCKEIVACVNCGKNYKIIRQELELLKKLGTPLPRLCYDCRHSARMALRTPRELWHRQCDCSNANHKHQGRCLTGFEATYDPQRPEIIYCEACYQAEVI